MDTKVSCESCGADLAFTPGTHALGCQYCGHQMQFSDPEAELEGSEEIDLEQYLDQFDAKSDHIELHTVRCSGCGAETELDAGQQSGNCPFCDTALVVAQAKTKQTIKPKLLLPFAVDKKDAREAFKAWVSKLWFAPNNLKKQTTQMDGFKGIYLPYWTYDCDTYSTYIGQRGDHYYVTVQSKDSEGKSVSRQERRTRWSSVSGRVSSTFDDIIIPAATSLPEEDLNSLEPWPLDKLVDYKDEYLAGFVSQTYDVDVKQGYQKAKVIMDDAIRDSIRADIGGDEQRILSVQSHYRDATFKHALFPVWVSAYQFSGKSFQVIINAQTAEVRGQRPWSWVKIASAAIAVAVTIAGVVYFLQQNSAAG